MERLTRSQKSEAKSLLKKIRRDIKTSVINDENGNEIECEQVYAHCSEIDLIFDVGITGIEDHHNAKVVLEYLIQDFNWGDNGWEVAEKSLYGATDILVADQVACELKDVHASQIRG